MFDKRYLSEFAKFFNTSVLIEFSNFGRSKFVDYVIEQSGILSTTNIGSSLLEVYNYAYDLLFTEYRCEYIYKNVIVNQVLIGKHSAANSTLFSEFRAGKSVADVLILNGTSSIYEIKTEYDNLDRLAGQLESYFLLFDMVNVITHSRAVEKIKKLVDRRVGILSLSGEGEIVTHRDPISNYRNVVPSVIFDSLRMSEFKEAINKHFGYIPNVPNTLIYRECKKLFELLPPHIAHETMVEVLKKRKQTFTKKLLSDLPVPLKMTCLNSNLTQSQWSMFQQVLTSNYL